jgi:hypothetical protein
MVDIIIAIGFITALLAGWVAVQHLARSYAARHPEFGPAREEGSGCGHSCLCSGGKCGKQAQCTRAPSHNNNDVINMQEDHQP